MSFKASYYIMRMVKYSGLSPSCFIAAVSYLERLKVRDPTIALSSQTLQRLLLVVVMIATKYLDDIAIDNARWYNLGILKDSSYILCFLCFPFCLRVHLNIGLQPFF